jgi:hypothetical protein
VHFVILLNKRRRIEYSETATSSGLNCLCFFNMPVDKLPIKVLFMHGLESGPKGIKVNWKHPRKFRKM